MLAFAACILLAAIVIPLSDPIVSLIFERQAFDDQARHVVSMMMSAYIGGGLAFIFRDIIVRVFYVVGDSLCPFYASMFTVVLNLLLNWLFVFYFELGSHGIVLSTVIANGLSTLGMLWAFARKIGGLFDIETLFIFLKTLFSGAISSAATYYTYTHLTRVALVGVVKAGTTLPWIGEALCLCVPAIMGLMTFLALVLLFRIKIGNSFALGPDVGLLQLVVKEK